MIWPSGPESRTSAVSALDGDSSTPASMSACHAAGAISIVRLSSIFLIVPCGAEVGPPATVRGCPRLDRHDATAPGTADAPADAPPDAPGNYSPVRHHLHWHRFQLAS